jgi:hypothetical protein
MSIREILGKRRRGDAAELVVVIVLALIVFAFFGWFGLHL